MITSKQLRDALGRMPAKYDDVEVQCWLPGSYIDLNLPIIGRNSILLEGNVVPGSALEVK